MYRKFLLYLPFTLLFLPTGYAAADEKVSAEDSSKTYELAYRFRENEVIRYKVEHVSTVETRISGTKETSKSHSASTKAWKVEAAEGDNMTFTHSIEDVDMWQQRSGNNPIRYNSKKDKEPPPQYQKVVDSLSKALAKVTINRSGKIIARESHTSSPDLGFGGLVVPLPSKPVEVGHVWTTPDEVKLRERDGRVKNVNTQIRYELEKVSAGIATIATKTQILTPVSDARLKSQLLQQISSGEIKFDLDAGRVVSKQLDWDETIIGFNGPASNMKYRARFTETLLDPRTAEKDTPTDVQ